MKRILLIILSIIFFIFEDIIWNQIVVKVLTAVKNLNLYNKYIFLAKNQNRYSILLQFCILFGLAEIIGLKALVLFAMLNLFLGGLFYFIKIVLTVLAFAILKECKEKLMSFAWFKYSYELITGISYKIKESEIYIKTREYILHFKTHLKEEFLKIKNWWKSYLKIES